MNKINFYKNYIEFTKNNRDSVIYGFDVLDIYKIHYVTINELREVIELFLKKIGNNKTYYLNYRLRDHDRNFKKILIEKGFFQTDLSFYISLRNYQNIDFNQIIRSNLKLEVPNKSKIDEVAKLAQRKILYGKFHEDPIIDFDSSKKRMFYKIHDLYEQGKKFLIYEKNNSIEGFFIYDFVDNNYIDAILATTKDTNASAYYFWSSVLTYFKKYKAKEIKTCISASNIGIINLYKKFLFKFNDYSEGYHLKIEKKI
jgi:CRISPR/Cas system-associated protein endoribonuclease Cas2